MMVKRYDLFGTDDFGHDYPAFRERDDKHGDWVQYEDYEALADVLLEMVTAWEPDEGGSDHRTWMRAKAALEGFTKQREVDRG
jgi:hypothetical protein